MATKTTKTLELVFRNTAGTEVIINVQEPLDTVTLSQATAAMQDIITKNLFSTTGGDLTSIVEARVRDLSVATLA